MMRSPIRRLLGVVGTGLSWSLVFGAAFGALGLLVGVIRPRDIGPGEGFLVFIGTGLLVGFVSGVVFGAIASLAESTRPIAEISLYRVAIWGVLAAAVWPLATIVHDSMVILLCPLGVLCAAASVVLARGRERSRPSPSRVLRLAARLFVSPLAAACASRG